MYSAAARGACLRLRQGGACLKRQRIGVRLARPSALVKQIWPALLSLRLSRENMDNDHHPIPETQPPFAADRGEHRQAAGAANKPAGRIIKLATSEEGWHHAA